MSTTVSAADLTTIADDFTRKGYSNPLVLVHTRHDPRLGTTLGDDPKRVEVRFAGTPLALRYFVKELERTRTQVYASIVLTSLQDVEVPLDVADSLTRRNIIRVDSSSQLRQLFGASRQRRGIVADTSSIPGIIAFLTRQDAGDVMPAPAGLLDQQHVNQEIIRSLLRSGYPVDLQKILQWSLSSGAVADWNHARRTLHESVLEQVLEHLSRELGGAARLVLAVIQQHGPERLAEFGLIAEMVVGARAFGVAEPSDTINLRHLLSYPTAPTFDELQGWARATRAAVARRGAHDERVRDAVVRAQRTALAVGAFDNQQVLVGSTVCPAAYGLRLDFLADALTHAPKRTGTPAHSGEKEGSGAAFALVLERYRQVLQHTDANVGDRDRQAAEAAVRLLNYQQRRATTQEDANRSPVEYVTAYRDEISWLDSAIHHAWAGGSNEKLADVTRTIAAQALEERVALNRAAATALAPVVSTTPLPKGLLGVENVLGNVVKPLLEEHRAVLLIVLDGMSVAASNDIVSGIMRDGQWKVAHPTNEALRSAVAALPTVTTFSRTTLLSGRLVGGAQHDEKKNFAAWFNENVPQQAAGQRAELFHKDALHTGIGTVREAVRDTEGVPLVGVVLNTIDDALDKDHPMSKKWSVGAIEHLAGLLTDASMYPRDVVLVADHGHVVERQTAGLTPTGAVDKGARWKNADGNVASDGEITVRGNRVLAAGAKAILAVDEDVRYTAKKAGYHGGLSLEELIVPITVLTQSGQCAGHLVSSDLEIPTWWFIPESAPVPQPGKQPGKKARRGRPESSDQDEINLGLGGTSPRTADGDDERRCWPDWAHELEKNTLFKRNVKNLEGRPFRVPEAIHMLVALESAGERLPVVEFRERFGIKNLAVRGVVAQLQRIVNRDGVEVLRREDDTLVFATALLREQFGIR